MTASQLTGVYAAVVTPFTSDGSAVNVPEIKRLVDHMVDGRISGLVPGGSTGEFTTLTPEEHKTVAEAYVEAAGGRVPVIVGTGALSTHQTVELSKHAESIGADGVMVVPPFYDAPSWDELVDHYRAVSEAISIPVMFYNIPAVTGVELTAEQLGDLGRQAGVSSFKDTGGDAPKFNEVLYTQSEAIQALNGWDTLSFQSLALGAKAAVWGAASIIPGLCADLYQAIAVNGDLAKGRDLWAKIHPICVFLESHNYAGAIKTGLTLVGLDAGPTRAPVKPLASEHVDELRGLLQAAGVRVN